MEGIIEGDQIQVAAFSLEYFSYLTCLPWANEHASIKSAKSGRLIKNEPHYWACVLNGPGWAQSNMRKTQEKKQPLESGHPR